MAHCKPNELDDIKEILFAIRSIPGLKEKQTGIFYFKGKGFLHFHSKDNKRWSDVRCGVGWGDPIDLPFKPTKAQQLSFLKSVKKYYKEI